MFVKTLRCRKGMFIFDNMVNLIIVVLVLVIVIYLIYVFREKIFDVLNMVKDSVI